ncbi:MAG: putative lipid II flippase FtsW [Nitrospirota bacterium]|nr:putative lipid II flippase FtsW [Nitrospirota bacterium]
MVRFGNANKTILTVVLLLVGIGVVMVTSSSSIIAMKRYNNSFYFGARQLFWVGLGLVAMLITSRIDFRKYYRLAVPLLAVSFVSLIAVLIIGVEVNGARRWIRLFGFNIQPSELAKFSFIIFMAYLVTKKGNRIKDLVYGFAPPMVILGAFGILLMLQPDLGSSVILAMITIVILFVGGARLHHIASLGLLAIPVMYKLITGSAYRRRRILAFLNPWDDPTGSGFQIVQSFIALGSGGPLGVGLGEGKQKLFYLPEAHTDFIFAVIGEELGFIGAITIIALFLVFLWQGVQVALKSDDDFGRYLAVGITTMISLQAALNLAVVSGLMPTKGLALPFISYGGSGIVVNLAAVGILLNVSKHRRMEREPRRRLWLLKQEQQEAAAH